MNTLFDVNLSETGHTLLVVARPHAKTGRVYTLQVHEPNGTVSLTVRGWDMLHMMFAMANLYKQYENEQEYDLIKQVIDEIKEVHFRATGKSPFWCDTH